MSETIIVGGTSGIGRALAASLLRRGHPVTIAGRDAARAGRAAREILADSGLPDSARLRGMEIDLTRPGCIARAVEDLGAVRHVVLAGMVRDQNSLSRYDAASALDLVTVKIVGYTALLHALRSRIVPDGSVLLFGGVSKDAPYPGSTTMTAVNAGVVGLVATFAGELAPVRVNAIHPGAVSDSPFWSDKTAVLDAARARTLTGRLPTMQDIVEGCLFLLENPSANGVNLSLDGGRA